MTRKDEAALVLREVVDVLAAAGVRFWLAGDLARAGRRGGAADLPETLAFHVLRSQEQAVWDAVDRLAGHGFVRVPWTGGEYRVVLRLSRIDVELYFLEREGPRLVFRDGDAGHRRHEVAARVFGERRAVLHGVPVGLPDDDYADVLAVVPWMAGEGRGSGVRLS